ncbi:MAG: glycosyltransferase family 4 protein [Planctomycetota bacterium]
MIETGGPGTTGVGTSLRIALVHARHAEQGGAETWLNQLATALVLAGHQPTIVCRRHAAAPHPDVEFARLRVRAPGNAARQWAFARAVERHVAANRYDVVVGLGRTYSHDVIRCGGAMRKTYLQLQRQFFYRPWERLLGKGQLKGSVAMALERRMFAPGNFRRVLANSDLLKRDIIAVHGVEAKQVVVVHNGVDVERFHPQRHADAAAALRREWQLADDDFLALFLGVGYARKGVSMLLQALPAVLEQRPNVRVVIVGSDRHAARWEQEAAQLGLGPGVGQIVHFAGRRSDPEVCFAAADLHVLPTWYDSFAYTVLESLASGVPVVTTGNAGAAELLLGRDDSRDEIGAVLPRRFEAAELSQVLQQWCDRDRVAACRVAARAVAEENSVSICMGKVVTLLEEVAREKIRQES